MASSGWGLGLAGMLAVGCTGYDGPGGGGDDFGGDGQSMTDGNGVTSADVPDSEYCADVSDWSLADVEFELAVLEQVNLERARGATCGAEVFGPASPLVMEPRLRCAARVHSLDMATTGFFDHDNPQGQSPFDRMELAGYSFRAAGENIAAGQPSVAEVMGGWMASSGHCRNIMSPDFTQLGVGYVFLDGNEYPHHWTQVFGAPL